MEETLVVRAQQGDAAAFSRLAVDLAPRLHAVAFRILREAVAAEDAVQQALLSSWQDLPQLRDTSRFEAWAYRVLVRACYAQARRERRHMPEVDLPTTGLCAPGDAYADVAIRDQLERGFQRLSVEQRTAVVLHHYLGYPVKDVAEMSGTSVETVRSRLKRAMARLRAALEADARSDSLNASLPHQVAT
jgi:RNA polymerase sigma-70 factor (ECF subfamily)